MAVISPAQAYTLARNAGFNPAAAAIMAAIAGGESGYRTDAEGDKGITTSVWGPSVGLWQIRSLKADTGTGRPRDASRLKDPVFNAKAAYSVYKSQGYNAWSVYSSGAYRKFLGKQGNGAPLAPTPGSGSSSPGSATPAAVAPVDLSMQLIDLPGGNWNPLNWPGAILGKTAKGVQGALWAQIQPFVITGAFVGFGLTLIAIGSTVITLPIARQATGTATGGTP